MTIRFFLGDGSREFDQVQAHGIELRMSPLGWLWLGGRQYKSYPTGAAIQHEAHLIG